MLELRDAQAGEVGGVSQINAVVATKAIGRELRASRRISVRMRRFAQSVAQPPRFGHFLVSSSEVIVVGGEVGGSDVKVVVKAKAVTGKAAIGFGEVGASDVAIDRVVRPPV
eukprot:scaffold117733_cov33-Phaeocystis_antarctica.AAC.2